MTDALQALFDDLRRNIDKLQVVSKEGTWKTEAIKALDKIVEILT